MKYLSKRNSFVFFLFLAVAFIYYFGFGKKILKKSELKQPFPVNSNLKRIKSPCREVSVKNKVKLKTDGSSQRIQKLTKLMDTPIDWIFKDIHGHVIDLYCLREKKILVINFWATWCPPCIEELPSLSQLAENNKDQIFVVAISAEPLGAVTNFLNHSFSDLSPYLKIAQISPEDKLQHFPEDTLPATYIFNKKGFLKAKELGPRDWSDKNLVQQILKLP